LPSLSTLEECNEVMTRYGLWHQLRLAQVASNLESGAVPVEDTLVFDTTHVEANSGCAGVVLALDDAGGKPKERKVCRLRKACDCGGAAWETCEHGWQVTDAGAAVVVKGATRMYWAHKTSAVTFGGSENGRSKAHVAERFDGIERFTRTGVPVRAAGHHFEMRGRDITQERYIWAAPDGADGNSVCDGSISTTLRRDRDRARPAPLRLSSRGGTVQRFNQRDKVDGAPSAP